MAAHAKLSASGAERWMNCAGSVAAENGLTDKSSPFAQEGSAAHELAEKALKEGAPCSDFIGTVFDGYSDWPVTDEMADYVQVYVDYVRSLGGTMEIEVRCDYSEWVADGFGTSDAVNIVGDTLYITDLKYGKGLPVYAEGNKQAQLYALGVYAEYRDIVTINNIVVAIVQPRLDHIDEWELSIGDLLKFGAYAADRAEQALSENAPRVAGEKQCQWCKAKATCGELKRLTEQTVMAHFDNETESLSDNQLREALENKKLIVSWLDSVEAYVKERLMNGRGFDGYKLVSGRSSRSWADEGDATLVLSALLEPDDIHTKKLISPAQAEKKLGKAKAAELAEHISVSTGAPTLAQEHDKRAAINVTAADFD